MYTLAFRITGNRDLASDVLQEAFIGVFKGLKNFQKRSTLGAWISIHCCKDRLQGPKKRKAHAALRKYEG